MTRFATAILVSIAIGLIAAGSVWGKFGSPGSDHQRLNALEQRVTALEEPHK